jgi:hypothetical protein
MENGVLTELLRAVNDRAFNTFWAVGAEEGDFACECGHTDCSERLDLTLIEYAAREDAQAILAPGHAPAATVPSSW